MGGTQSAKHHTLLGRLRHVSMWMGTVRDGPTPAAGGCAPSARAHHDADSQDAVERQGLLQPPLAFTRPVGLTPALAWSTARRVLRGRPVGVHHSWCCGDWCCQCSLFCVLSMLRCCQAAGINVLSSENLERSPLQRNLCEVCPLRFECRLRQMNIFFHCHGCPGLSCTTYTTYMRCKQPCLHSVTTISPCLWGTPYCRHNAGTAAEETEGSHCNTGAVLGLPHGLLCKSLAQLSELRPASVFCAQRHFRAYLARKAFLRLKVGVAQEPECWLLTTAAQENTASLGGTAHMAVMSGCEKSSSMRMECCWHPCRLQHRRFKLTPRDGTHASRYAAYAQMQRPCVCCVTALVNHSFLVNHTAVQPHAQLRYDHKMGT